METWIEPNASVPERWQTLRQKLATFSDAQLRAYLAERLQLTADNLAELALVVREFEERGLDLSQFKIALLVYLRRIAYGQTLPEVVAALAGRPSLLQRVAFLPLPDQQRCIGSDGVTVAAAVLTDGRIDTRHKPLLALEPREVRQVFGPNGLRSPVEQMAWLRSQELPVLQPAVEKPSYVIEKQCLVVNRPTRLTRRDLMNILKAM